MWTALRLARQHFPIRLTSQASLSKKQMTHHATIATENMRFPCTQQLGLLASTIMAMAMVLAFVDVGFFQSAGLVSKRGLQHHAGDLLSASRYACASGEARDTATWFVTNGKCSCKMCSRQ